MEERLDSVVTSLQTEEEALQGRKSTLRKQVDEIDFALKQVRAALTALGVRTSGKSGGRRASAKPSPDKISVREAVVGSLDGHTLTLERLRGEVERRLQEQGYSRMGLALRLKEVLAESEFVETPTGYQFQHASEPPSPSDLAG
ncbi:hypothetical protein [Botrimarina sp.]|uniref:hypothetical protein n=1 Tax=Botrimarina sp. TaxID=2795802 RepID=UPI0032EC5A3C